MQEKYFDTRRIMERISKIKSKRENISSVNNSNKAISNANTPSFKFSKTNSEYFVLNNEINHLPNIPYSKSHSNKFG